MTIAQDQATRGAVLRYRNREVTAADLEYLSSEAASCGSRQELCAAVCATWGWRQANGNPSLMACKDLLRRLEERGHLRLPPRRGKEHDKRRDVGRLQPVLPADLVPLAWTEVADPHVDLESLVVRPIAPEERHGWRMFIGRYHYLGDRTIVGEHLLYAGLLDGEVVALLGWASAALHAPWRDDYIGWDEETKRRRLQLVASNVRFLVPPWVRVKCLASKVLSLCLRRLSRDWQATWGHPVLLAETFVDTARFKGTCYRASNWTYLGHTAGRAKRGNDYSYHGEPKALFVYPLHRHACRLLRGGEQS